MNIHSILQIVNFVDISCISSGVMNYLIVLERRPSNEGGTRDSSAGFTLISTQWHIWYFDQQTEQFRKSSVDTVSLPGFITLDLISHSERSYGLITGNLRAPAILVGLTQIGKETLQISQRPGWIEQFHLEVSQIERVHIPPNGFWSTPMPGLSCEEHLFNPNIFFQPSNNSIWVCMNTADGGAILWEYNLDHKLWVEEAYWEAAIEPVYQELLGHRFIACRRPPSSWPVFFTSPPRFKPTLLPLILSELESETSLQRSERMIELGDIGEVFSFDFASDGERQLGLAVVSRLRDQPILTLLISEDLGKKWDKKYTIPLQDSPYRMGLALSEQEALVGLVFKQPEDYKIAAVRCKL